MNCPIDQTPLVITDRQGVEIDYCPKCRGIWLDRNELDKLIERATQYHIPQQRQPEYHDEHREERREHHYDDRRHDDDDHRGHHRPHHKKESFLGDLFDF